MVETNTAVLCDVKKAIIAVLDASKIRNHPTLIL